MSIGIKVADATFTKYLARAVPLLGDLEGLWIFGGSAADSVRNRSPNAVFGTEGTGEGGGSGTFTGTHALLSKLYSLNTGLQYGGLNKTVISVSDFSVDQASSASAPQLEMSRTAGAFRVRIASSGYIFASGDTVSLNQPLFQALASGAVGAGNDVAYVGRGGTLHSANGAAASVTAGAIVFGPRGGRAESADSATHRHFLGMVYSRQLTALEMAEVYGWAAEYLAARGIVLG